MMITPLSPGKAIRVVLFLTTAATAVVGSTTRNIVHKNEVTSSSSSTVVGDSSSSQHHRALLGLNEMDCKEAVENDGSIVCRFRIMPPTTTDTTSSSSTNTPKTLLHDCLMRVDNFCITAEVYPYDHAYHQQTTTATTNNSPPPRPPPPTTTTDPTTGGNDTDLGSINAEEIGGNNNCDSKVACRACLADETSTCGWVPAVEGCLESCNIIADASCYNIQSFNRDNNNNNNNNMMTGEDICVVAENELTDMTLCKSQTDCTSCIDTNIVSETSSWKTCQWFPDGNYCSSRCGMAGCGETICSTDSDEDGQEMTATMVGAPLPSFCAADSDCHTTSPDSEDFYCAAGTCLPQGGCLLDTDCVNPSNEKFKDTKCAGYLFCDTTTSNTDGNGRCVRKCTGFACPDEVPATECAVTGCETRIACPGSVNCVVDHCDSNCKGLFFDSAGTVLEECTGGKGGGGSGTIAATLSSAVVPPTAPADQEPALSSHSETIQLPSPENGPNCPSTMPNNGSTCDWLQFNDSYQCGYFSGNEKPQLPGTFMMVCNCASTNAFVCATAPKETYYGVSSQSASSF